MGDAATPTEGDEGRWGEEERRGCRSLTEEWSLTRYDDEGS
jgi:hypothetical protein